MACRLKTPRVLKDSAREGYVSLLAMSFAFGLAIFGTALAVALRAYLAATGAEEQTIRTRIALESASAAVLGEMVAGQPSAPIGLRQIGTRSLTVTLSRPDAKLDFEGDGSTALSEALARQGLAAAGDGSWRGARNLAEVSARLGLSAAEEDCLRRAFTFGRSPAPLSPEAGSADPPLRLGAGDQLDLRASVSGARVRDEVLWLRVRFTGGETGWKVHDYRRLRGQVACRSRTP